MNPLADMRSELRACGVEGFLRRAREPALLLVGDAPRHMRTDVLAEAMHRAACNGFMIVVHGDLIQIDLTAERYHQMLARVPERPLPPMQGRNETVWAAASRLVHLPPDAWPPDVISCRALLKAIDEGAGGVHAFCDAWPPYFAALQRTHRPPPRALGALLIQWMEAYAC